MTLRINSFFSITDSLLEGKKSLRTNSSTSISSSSTLVNEKENDPLPKRAQVLNKIHSMQAGLIDNYKSGKKVMRENVSPSANLLNRPVKFFSSSDIPVVKNANELEALCKVGKGNGIKRIMLDGEDFSNEDMALLSEKFPSLKYLQITKKNDGITDAGLYFLGRLPLSHLQISSRHITDAGMQHLEDMPLKRLEMINCGITDGGMQYIRNAKLNHLNLSGCSGITGNVFSTLEKMDIKNLKLAHTGIGNITEPIVTSIVNMRALQHLDIKGSYKNCSISAFNVLRAMLDVHLVSDGIAGKVGGGEHEEYVLPLMEKLLNGKRITHAPSRAWAAKLVQPPV